MKYMGSCERSVIHHKNTPQTRRKAEYIDCVALLFFLRTEPFFVNLLVGAVFF